MNVKDVLVELAGCLCNQLEEDGLPLPCFCGVLPGAQVAYDYALCEHDDGIAWTRLVMAYPASGVGRVDTTLGNCAGGFGFEVEIGVMRRAPLLDDEGNPPSVEDQLCSTNLQMDDMQAMRKAVACCGVALDQYILGQYRPHGPQGGIVGGTWTLMVAL